jgi:hypothetical protein
MGQLDGGGAAAGGPRGRAVGVEAQREGWGTRGTVGAWFAAEESAMPGVQDELLDPSDDVGVGRRASGCGLRASGCVLRAGGKLVS